MASKPKLEHVAKVAGVSTATASQVMRGTGRISAKTRKKVQEAARDMHYVPDVRAASMRSGQNREIGFVINQLSNPFNAEVISGVSDLMEKEGFLVSVLDARDDTERQGRHVDAFIRNGRGGLIWVPAADTPASTVELLKRHAIPTVTFLRRTDPAVFDHVGIRNTQATREATRYLVELGHQRIAFFGGTDMTIVRKERIAGYLDVLKEYGLDHSLVWNSEENKMAALNAMLALCDKHPETTALVCHGDVVALGACLAMNRLGLTPGRDLSIVGFDNIPDAAVSTPPLTTMAVSPYQLGRRLARVLLDRLREPALPVTVTEISAELIVRETTGRNDQQNGRAV